MDTSKILSTVEELLEKMKGITSINKEKYINILTNYEFIHHNLSSSIPIYDNRVANAFSFISA